MKMTSAVANKFIRKLTDEYNFIRSSERDCDTYVLATGETADPPVYDYAYTNLRLAEIDRKIAVIKHALNVNNTITSMELAGGTVLTIDQALVVMAQLNSRLAVLDTMRKRQDRTRVGSITRSSGIVLEYRYLNYDPKLVERDYEKLFARIVDIQLRLDKLNYTVEFEVDI